MGRRNKKLKDDPSASHKINHKPNIDANFDWETTHNIYANVFDLASTLSQIMIICGIDECKADAAMDTSIYAFLHYDRECFDCNAGPKKRIRKKDVCHDLTTKCFMNRLEVYLAFKIIEHGFKAFYSRPKEDRMGNLWEKYPYSKAARKTTQAFTRLGGLTCKEQRFCQMEIKKAYSELFYRMQERKRQSTKTDCQCCLCEEKDERPAKVMPVPSKPEIMKPVKDVKVRCPKCCRLIKPKPQPNKTRPKSECKDSKNTCICSRSPIGLKWVKSIWDRPDMNAYYRDTIINTPGPSVPCAEWPDPVWLKLLAGKMQPDEADCDNWYDPNYFTADIPCEEWHDPSWIKQMGGNSKITNDNCSDWFDPAKFKPLQ